MLFVHDMMLLQLVMFDCSVMMVFIEWECSNSFCVGRGQKTRARNTGPTLNLAS